MFFQGFFVVVVDLPFCFWIFLSSSDLCHPYHFLAFHCLNAKLDKGVLHLYQCIFNQRNVGFFPWCPIWIQETLLPLMELPPFTSAKKLSSFPRIMRALSESFLDVEYSLSWESPFCVAPNSSSLMQLTQFSASSQAASKETPQEQSRSWMKEKLWLWCCHSNQSSCLMPKWYHYNHPSKWPVAMATLKGPGLQLQYLQTENK